MIPVVRAAPEAACAKSSSSQHPSIGENACKAKQPKCEPSITAFELAHIATQLSVFYGNQPPSSYLTPAHELLRESAAFLENVEKDLKTVTFDELLNNHSVLPTGQGKSPLGGFATKEGLFKAIRREFDLPDRELVIMRGWMTVRQVDRLRERLKKRRASNAHKSRPGREANAI